MSHSFMHTLVSQPIEWQKKCIGAELKGPEKTCKTPGATYLGYRAIYLGFYDLSKYG